jgi:hypothetical protein
MSSCHGYPTDECQNRPVLIAGRASLWREPCFSETFYPGLVQMAINPLLALFDHACPQGFYTFPGANLARFSSGGVRAVVKCDRWNGHKTDCDSEPAFCPDIQNGMP